MNESILQQQIVVYLKSKQDYYLFRFFHCPNEGRRKVWYLKKLKAMGLKNGVPDLILEFPKSKFIYCEIKMPKGRLSPAQRHWKMISSVLGTPFFVLQGTIDECKKQIDSIFKDYQYAKIRKNGRRNINK
tara:strand:- start:9511 stop:9900 length:390 start_codon:yes stop_codon:yes gene_type:complete